MANYYNEIDKFAAEWLQNLIAAGLIAPGVVDTRSIVDVRAADLVGFDQCHFFAGIGGWPLALRLAGVPDDYPVWTGSCPCQPFSAAGKGTGFDDERHLWPVFKDLIAQRRPAGVLGEQVASKDADPWIDLVHTDLEALGYAFGAVPFPSAGVGAPHIRDRLYWMAHADRSTGGKRGADIRGRADGSDAQSWPGSGGGIVLGGLGDTHHPRLEGHAGHGGAAGRQGPERPVAAAGVPVRMADAGSERFEGLGLQLQSGEPRQANVEDGRSGEVGGLANSDGGHAGAERQQHGRQQRLHAQHDGDVRCAGGGREDQPGDGMGSGPTNGIWSDTDWLFCRDAKWRPVEAGTFPLADGLPRSVGSGGAGLERLAGVAGLDNASLARAKSYRVGALRGYGNAINPHQAALFIEVALEAMEGAAA